MNQRPMPNSGAIAAIDIGSNSFHLIIAEPFQQEFRTLEKRGVRVQLAAGLNQQKVLSAEAIERGIDCLRDFAQRLQGFAIHNVCVRATNALRVARNSEEFIQRAREVLPYPIEIISGREEARLIYQGVSHTVANDGGRRLVFDIGGGSTECVLGEGFSPLLLDSLAMGCVSYTKTFFPDGEITRARMQQAINTAKRELLNILPERQQQGWQAVIGSSGTIRAAEHLANVRGWCEHHLTATAMDHLVEYCLSHHKTEDMQPEGLKPERRTVFIGGVAILAAIFDVFEVTEMIYSDGALREGILWQMLGETQNQDIRQRTLVSLQDRFHIDHHQGKRVRLTADQLFQQLLAHQKNNQQQENQQQEDQQQSAHQHRVRSQISANDAVWLAWAAELHEIGLSLTHSGFHKHGAYLLQHSDLLGFTRQEQNRLAALVRLHRRKLKADAWDALLQNEDGKSLTLVRLLRLAVVLNLSRGRHPVPSPRLTCVAHDHWQLEFSKGWLASHTLTHQDLLQESKYLEEVGLSLSVIDG